MLILLFLGAGSLSAQGIEKNVEEVKTCCKNKKVSTTLSKAEAAPCCKASKAAMVPAPAVRDIADSPATTKKTEKAFIDVKAVKVKKSTRLKHRKTEE